MSHELGHPDAGRLQALLDGELSKVESAALEEHLLGCPRCAAELATWRSLFVEIAELPDVAPSAGFTDAVMARLPVRQSAPVTPAATPRPLAVPSVPLPLGARLRGWLGGGPAPTEHVGPERIQDWLDGRTRGRAAALVEAHLHGCAACALKADAWRSLLRSLDALPTLAPADGFAQRVMARVRIPAAAPARVSLVARGTRWVRERIPSRRAVAAAAGVALTPAVTLALVGYVVFSHPLVTIGNLISFLWLKWTAWAGGGFQALLGSVMESALLFRAVGLALRLGESPVAAAGSLLLFSTLMLAALWVLYRNLFAPAPAGGRYARLSI